MLNFKSAFVLLLLGMSTSAVAAENLSAPTQARPLPRVAVEAPAVQIDFKLLEQELSRNIAASGEELRTHALDEPTLLLAEDATASPSKVQLN
ncbi:MULTISPECIES: hypothetical protein [Shewanella]|jgi:hypothetical protein|uniref:hypothetical protein n=1 Tax=Shewanella TaxID=22 RepID=UPI0008F88E64|nr:MULTISPECIES: hypothetical protein [Shewanella]MCE9790353.1 hypothetical protein [Shewanella indica]NDO74546.1 hypothetical protein [Shewanella sp. SE1]OIN14877.1 hypothetical protein BFS86_02155 [Shewanella algae]GHB05100.1 hypothetical protein GCM10007107_17620 [Shewanella indica]